MVKPTKKTKAKHHTAEEREAGAFYRPQGRCDEFIHAKDPEILLEGPAGCGKTRAIWEKVFQCMTWCPGARVLAVRRTRASMSETVLPIWEEEVIPHGHPLLRGASRAMRKTYHHPNGSVLVCGGMDYTDSIMGSGYHLIVISEATELSEGHYDKLTTRLGHGLKPGTVPHLQLIADCNPSFPSHWLHQRSLGPKMRRICSTHQDNPRLYDATKQTWTPAGIEYRERLSRLSAHRRARLMDGIWAAAEGLVWDRYNPALHLIDRFAIPAAWRRIASVDFGFRHPCVVAWWAIDGDGRMYLYRMIHRTNMLLQDIVPEIVRLSAGERIETYVCDHDIAERDILERAGLRTTPANKDVKLSYNKVQDRFATAGDGRPRIFFLRDSVVTPDPLRVEDHRPWNIEQELESHQWIPTKDGKSDKEDWVKEDDDAIDTMRYAVMYVDGGSRFERPTVQSISGRMSRPTQRGGVSLI